MRLFLFFMTKRVSSCGVEQDPLPLSSSHAVFTCAHTHVHTHTSSLTVVTCLLKPQSFTQKTVLVMRPKARARVRTVAPSPLWGHSERSPASCGQLAKAGDVHKGGMGPAGASPFLVCNASRVALRWTLSHQLCRVTGTVGTRGRSTRHGAPPLRVNHQSLYFSFSPHLQRVRP